MDFIGNNIKSVIIVEFEISIVGYAIIDSE